MRAVPVPMVELLRRVIEEESKADELRHKKVENVFHASSVWSCYRQQWYSWKGHIPTNPKRTGLLFMGKLVEKIGQAALEKQYPGLIRKHTSAPFIEGVSEVDCRECDHARDIDCGDFKIAWECDPVLHSEEGRPEVLYEFKSSGAGANSKPGSHHLHQASIYAHVLDVSETRIVQPSRDDILDCAETVVNKEELDRYWKESVHYFQFLKAALTSDNLPPAIPFRDWNCDYCPFKSQCVKDGGWTLNQRTITRGKRKGVVVDEWTRDAPPIEGDA